MIKIIQKMIKRIMMIIMMIKIIMIIKKKIRGKKVIKLITI